MPANCIDGIAATYYDMTVSSVASAKCSDYKDCDLCTAANGTFRLGTGPTTCVGGFFHLACPPSSQGCTYGFLNCTVGSDPDEFDPCNRCVLPYQNIISYCLSLGAAQWTLTIASAVACAVAAFGYVQPATWGAATFALNVTQPFDCLLTGGDITLPFVSQGTITDGFCMPGNNGQLFCDFSPATVTIHRPFF